MPIYLDIDQYIGYKGNRKLENLILGIGEIGIVLTRFYPIREHNYNIVNKVLSPSFSNTFHKLTDVFGTHMRYLSA